MGRLVQFGARVAIFAATLMGSAAAYSIDKVTYVTAWLPDGQEAYPYVGVQEGFFAAEGIEVTIQVGRGAADAIAKIAGGTADFGDMSIGALMAATVESKVPMKALMSIYAKQPDCIYTIKGSGITSIKDLGGRSVATALFSGSNTIWPAFVTLNGLDPSKISLSKVDANTLGPLLATGKVDATIGWMSGMATTKKFVDQAKKELVVIPWSNYGLEGYGLALVASDRVIKSNPDLVARFSRAYKKAMEFMMVNPAKSAQDLHAMVPGSDVKSDTQLITDLKLLMQNDITDKFGFGAFDPTWLYKSWEWVAKAQNYSLDRLDPETVVDRRFTPKKP